MIHPRIPSDGEHMTVLAEAQAAVMRRGEAYGKPRPFFAATARRWSLELGVEVTPAQVIRCLIQMKLQRALNGGGFDCFVDIAGYGAIGAEVDAGTAPASAVPAFGRSPATATLAEQRLDNFITDLRGRARDDETWEALRKVLAALRGDWLQASRTVPWEQHLAAPPRRRCQRGGA